MEEDADQPGRQRGPRARELRILYRVAEALNSAPDVQQALEHTLALVADLLGLRTGWVWLLDPATGRFYSAAARNLPPYLQQSVRMTGAPCWCIEAFNAGRLTPENIRLIQCSRLAPAVAANDTGATLGLSCHASIPLAFGEKPLGIMNITAPAWRALTRGELRLLATIAYQAGIAIERARLAEESARLARVEERARLAREIHDTLAQGLTAIGLHVEGALRHVMSDPERARERLQRALDLTRQNLEEARRSVLNLRAAPLEGRPLAEALRALSRSLTHETGIRIQCHVDAGLPEIVPPQLEAELFRIAQEALTNTVRHARATQAAIALQYRAATLRLSIHDNGVGFRPRATAGGQGILGMRERARLLDGRLRITSRPGRGTTVTAEIPVRQEE